MNEDGRMNDDGKTLEDGQTLWVQLGDTQPIPVTTEVYRDDVGWWERFVTGLSVPEPRQ